MVKLMNKIIITNFSPKHQKNQLSLFIWYEIWFRRMKLPYFRRLKLLYFRRMNFLYIRCRNLFYFRRMNLFTLLQKYKISLLQTYEITLLQTYEIASLCCGDNCKLSTTKFVSLTPELTVV